jgi:nucleotide-binding universal stress UspA family protein
VETIMAIADVEIRTTAHPAADAMRKGYRDVLALVTSTGPWSPAAWAALDIASTFGANLTGCYMDPSLRSLRGVDDEPTVMALLMDAPRQCTEDQKAFRAFADAAGVCEAGWIAAREAPAKILRKLGAWHDLVVIERDIAIESAQLDVLGEVLLTCRVACLVLPPRWDRPARFKHVVAGWNGSIESARAIHAALPIAMNADRVTVLTDRAVLEREGAEQDPGFHPLDYLRAHGVSAKEERVSVGPMESGRMLLHKAERLSADCLVMGAYGHARVRERILGGATRHVLQNAPLPLPLLMQH